MKKEIISPADYTGPVGICLNCGGTVADYTCNDHLINKRPDAGAFYFWVSCVNPECPNHEGEGYFQTTPGWVKNRLEEIALIRVFCISVPDEFTPDGVQGYSVDMDGKTINEHYCTSLNWAKHDLGHKGDNHPSVYSELFPKGYIVMWMDEPPDDWDGGSKAREGLTGELVHQTADHAFAAVKTAEGLVGLFAFKKPPVPSEGDYQMLEHKFQYLQREFAGFIGRVRDMTRYTAESPLQDILEECEKWDRHILDLDSMAAITPIGVDNDGNGLWTDGFKTWNAGEPLTPEELAEVKSIKPTLGLLMSMAIRSDHAIGVPGYYDQMVFGKLEGPSHAVRLKILLADMKKVWEEVTGHGFYKPEKEDIYAAMAKKALGGEEFTIR